MLCLASPVTCSLHRGGICREPRLLPILLFSLTAGVIYTFVATRWGRWAALLAVGSWILQPNLFGHAHYAAYDAVLTCLWVLAIVVFTRAVAPQTSAKPDPIRWGWTLAFGLIAGCAPRDQADGLVLARAVPGLGQTLSEPARIQNHILRLVGCNSHAVRLDATMVDGTADRARSIFSIESDASRNQIDPNSISEPSLRYTQTVAPLVQHARLDSDGDSSRVPADGKCGILGGFEKLAKRTDRTSDRGKLDVLDGVAGDATHTRT